MENVVVQQPFPSKPFSTKDYVMLTPTKAVLFGNDMLSSSDQKFLARKSDFTVLDESMCLSVQATSSMSNLCL